MTPTMPSPLIIVAPTGGTIRSEDIFAINAVANMIGAHPIEDHRLLLAVLVARLERAGVIVPEVWREALEELN